MKILRLFMAVFCFALSSFGQAANHSTLDVEKATRSYLDRISPEKKAQSDAYFEGGYWLQLWNFI